ncbi:MAG: hypothetical protein KDB68_00965 [Planctomycetes bacterium]|nr:hypothetical protein [Planctomycetota bacterium]
MPLVRSSTELAALPPDTRAIEFYAEESTDEYSFERFDELTNIRTDGNSLFHLSSLKTVTHLEVSSLNHPNVELWNLREWANLESVSFSLGTKTFGLGLQFLTRNTRLKRFSARTIGLYLTPQAVRYLAEFSQLEYLSGCLAETTAPQTARALAELRTNEHLAQVELGCSGAMVPETVQELAKLPGLSVLDLRGAKLLEDITEPLQRHAGLREVAFYNHRLSPEMLKNLASCPNLQRLYLTYCKGISDTGLLELKDHPSIQQLDLSDVDGVTSTALKQLRCPKLQNLNLANCSGIEAQSVASLAELPVLKEMSVGGNEGFDDKSMALIARMKGLSSLRLYRVEGLSEEGWTELLKMNWLEDLIVYSSDIPPDLLPRLTELENLETLSLRGSVNMSDDLFRKLTGLPRLRYLACDTDCLGEDVQIEVHEQHPGISQVVRPPRNTSYQAQWWKTQEKLWELFPEQVRRERGDDSEYWWQD